jgi:hypothetical protein
MLLCCSEKKLRPLKRIQENYIILMGDRKTRFLDENILDIVPTLNCFFLCSQINNHFNLGCPRKYNLNATPGTPRTINTFLL